MISVKRNKSVRLYVLAAAVALALTHLSGWGQEEGGAPAPRNQAFVMLTNNANAVIAEPAVSDPARNRVVFLTVHPERANMFNSWIARELARRGYRTMMMNYYGPEQTYDEFLAPIAAAIKRLRSLPGAEKVVLIGGSTGGAEESFYQDVAENGAKVCQAPEVVYPCRGKNLDNLPKADAIIMLDINAGAPLRTIAVDPAVDSQHPGKRDAALDMFDPRNGFDPNTEAATYSPQFAHQYLAAQGARANKLIDEALARLARIEKGEGDYKDDEPFVVPGSSRMENGARLDLADRHFMARTHAPHPLLKADGTVVTQIVPSVLPPVPGNAAGIDTLEKTTQDLTVRHFLSFYALRTTAEYAVTENDVKGIVWHSTVNSAPGNVEGVRVPTLIMAGTCYGHMVMNEIVFDHSAAQDKEYVAVEGGNHTLQPCKPEYGDTSKRAFDYLENWLKKPGRL
jgi:pimeloyl-ACP methyl ester carboxylesterase